MVQQEADASSAARHPIRVVSQRTGLGPDLLRAWENRYGAVRPGRSDGGHRLYSDDDIRRLSLLARVTDAGRAISQVADLPTDELAEMAREDDEARARSSGEERRVGDGDATAARAREEAVEAVRRLDQEGLARILRRAVLELGTVPFLQEVAAPFLREVGELWHEGTLRPAHEHLASVSMRRVLDWVIGSTTRTGDRPRIVIGTPAGEHHEMGALLAAAAAESAGWEAIYLGPDLPADEFAQAAVWTGARAVALSTVFAPELERVGDEILDVRGRLPPSVTLMVGGRAAEEIEAVTEGGRVVPVAGIPEFIGMLRGLAP